MTDLLDATNEAMAKTFAPPAKPKSPAQRLAKLDVDIANAKVVYETLKAQRPALETQVVAWMQDNGTSSMKVDGRTVYMARDIFAGKKSEISHSDFLDIMHTHGHREFDGYSWQTLRSFIKEQLGLTDAEKAVDLGFNEDGSVKTLAQYAEENLPTWLREIVVFGSEIKVRTRKASK